MYNMDSNEFMPIIPIAEDYRTQYADNWTQLIETTQKAITLPLEQWPTDTVTPINSFTLNCLIADIPNNLEQLSKIRHLLGTGLSPDRFSLNVALHTKNPEIVQIIVDAGAPSDFYTLDIAVRIGLPELLIPLSAIPLIPGPYSMMYSCYEHNVSKCPGNQQIREFIVQKMNSQPKEWLNFRDIVYKSTKAQSLGSLPTTLESIALRSHDLINLTGEQLNFVVRIGNLDILEYILYNCGSIEFAPDTMYHAIRTKCPKKIQLLLDNGCPVNAFNLDHAINTGIIQIIQLIKDNGGSPTFGTLNQAILTKSLEIVKLAITVSASRDESSLQYAKRFGTLEIFNLIQKQPLEKRFFQQPQPPKQIMRKGKIIYMSRRRK